MTSFFIQRYFENGKPTTDPARRRACGTAVSVVGILANLFLSAVKLVAGWLSGSLAVTADAVNNLSDAASQVVSLISFKISAKPADRDHPFGHARMEYVASMIVSFLILTVGVELLRESVLELLNPKESNFSPVVLGVSVLVKLWLAFFNFRVGKRMDSSVIRATAADSLSDAVATAAVLISAVIARFTGFRADSYMGIAVAILILVAGIKTLNDTKNSILGSAPDPAVIEGIVRLTEEHPEILGIHDMVVHSYGPGNVIASFHAEVDGGANVFVTHDVIDTVEKRIWQELSIRATIHMDPIVTDDERVTALRQVIAELVREEDPVLTIHDFRFVEGHTHTNLIFDVTAPFELKLTDDELKRRISSRISRIEPNYFAVITVDRQ